MKDKTKRGHRFFSSLYWRISAIFLVILLILSVIYVYISTYTAEMYYQEAIQRLNADIAPHIVAENQCFVNGEANVDALQDEFHSVMVINPSIEIYLLNTQGKIVTYFAPFSTVILDSVPIAPIKEFINDTTGAFVIVIII